MVIGRTLVTGATGGLGRVLAAALHAAGRPVVATGRNLEIGQVLEAAGLTFRPADLAGDDLTGLLEGVDSVFHLAALSRPWGPPEAFTRVNVTATNRLLTAARAAGCKRFIFASTPSVYTCARDQFGLSEASALPVHPVNSYAATKLIAERQVRAAAEPGFATVALRPRAIIGPHDKILLPRLLRAAAKGVLPLPRGGEALIEPSDVRDVTRAFLAAEAAAPGVAGQVFNISGGTAIPIRELAGHVFRRLNRRVRIVNVPGRIALLAASAMEGVAMHLPGRPEPVLTRYGAMVVGWSQTFDLSAAHRHLDWSPCHTPTEAVDWALTGMGHA